MSIAVYQPQQPARPALNGLTRAQRRELVYAYQRDWINWELAKRIARDQQAHRALMAKEWLHDYAEVSEAYFEKILATDNPIKIRHIRQALDHYVATTLGGAR